MRTGGVSNLVFNPMQTKALNGNDTSNTALNLLQKQKMQIQEQIKGIEESKLAKEIKEEKIKALQEQLKEIEKQIIVEQAKKLTEGMEVKNTKQEAAPEDNENSQVINKNVTTGIISASRHLETGRVAFSVYKQEKTITGGDIGKMERALSYAIPEFKKASQSTKLIEKGIKEYRIKASKANESDNPAKPASDHTVHENGADGAVGMDEKKSLNADGKSDNNVSTTLNFDLMV